jgi:CBS domain-containing protein
MKVKDVMMRTHRSCLPNTGLVTAAKLMNDGNFGLLPVQSSQGVVIGVITSREISLALETRELHARDLTVADVITGNLYFCSPEDDVHLALETMQEAKVHRLPVTAQNGTLVGVISRDSILSHVETSCFGEGACDTSVH